MHACRLTACALQVDSYLLHWMSTAPKDTIATANPPAGDRGGRCARLVSAGLGRPQGTAAEKAWSRLLALYDSALA
jgi:hypothetical protein